ncbi:glycosyltransferase [Lysinibacillus yapensis]|uniref:Glycosyltransferase n=1 Tax=Ureibacillus yapensis TaxID=2304605 RepID=A0A396SJM7_9BACL|nr:glycosyltransferase [Lysinibacillus yapensis]RHW39559.1 glycosyltransferase [Lysinibacillus yapensis]
MKVIFFHDGPIKKDEDNNYYGTAHNDDTFKRYYQIADELGVVIREVSVSKSEAEQKLSKITVSPFEVVACPNISSLKGILLKEKKAKEIIYKEIEKCDYVVARIPSMIGFIAIDYAIKLKKPYLVEVVTCPWDAFWNHSIKGKIVAPFMYKKTKDLVRNAEHVLYVTNEFLQKRYPTKGKSVNCSNVALKKFDNSTLENRIKKITNMNKDRRVIIGTTAAVDIRFKGQQYVIEALGKLKSQGYNNFEYHLVGGGDQKYLKNVAEKNGVTDRVKFLGSVQHNDVFKWLDGIDIYVQPSRQEGLPRALIEAMSKGLPAFGARTAGIPELLEKEFVFSNSKNNLREICNILTSFDKETMLSQAKRNYEESKKYDSSLIEERRRNFFRLFKESY